MKRYLLLLAAAAVAALAFPSIASAQSGHFVGNQTCTDIGTQLQCTGKVAGLGGTEFEITVSGATGTASVTCRNPAGNVAPGQAFSFPAGASSGPLATPQNGNYTYSLATLAPSAPAGSCPNRKWTATVDDVTFTGTVTITLTEDGVVSDTFTVVL